MTDELAEQKAGYAAYLDSFEGAHVSAADPPAHLLSEHGWRCLLATAAQLALRNRMEADPKVLVMGLDVGKLGGVFRITDGLQKDFGEDRVIDAPLGESGIIGAAVGLAIRGYRPVCEIQFDGFVYPAFDQIVSQVAKFHNRSLGQVKMPITVRIPYGGGIGAVEHHSRVAGGVLRAHRRAEGGDLRQPVGCLLDAAPVHRLRRPGDLLRAQAPVLGQGRGRHRGQPAAAARVPGGPAGQGRHAGRLRPDGGDRAGRGQRRGARTATRSR